MPRHGKGSGLDWRIHLRRGDVSGTAYSYKLKKALIIENAMIVQHCLSHTVQYLPHVHSLYTLYAYPSY